MKKYLAVSLLVIVFLTGCTVPENDNPLSESICMNEPLPTESVSKNSCIPINYTKQIGMWLPFMDFEYYMYGKTKEEYTAAVRELLENAINKGVNTIYFHAHPNGDAYYKSDIFPKGVFYDGDYDPLQIMLDTAHSLGLSVHAWLNPYRMQTAEQMENLPEDFIVKKWVSDKSPMVKNVDGRYYLNPAYEEVTELVRRTADEILENYLVDGIHIDDYFYPTTDTEFDSEAFEVSESKDLAQWRREKITGMVKSLYDTVKSHDEKLKFGISPQGNINTDYNTQYADVELWAETDGYADYIVPQLYYGFENAVCPFEPTLIRWEELTDQSEVSLIIGLAEYKLGKYDKWAGTAGENEWIDNPDILERQIKLVKSSTAADGYALYTNLF